METEKSPIHIKYRLSEPWRRVLILTVIPVVFILTVPFAVIPLLQDPTGFAPISRLTQFVIVFAVAVASATPILAAANAASLSSTAPEGTPRKKLRYATFNVMGWTWSILAGLVPATLLALLHRRISSMVFWCIHSPFETGACLPVNYRVVMPQALPNVMPAFLSGVLMCMVVTWAAVRLGVIVGQRVRDPGRAVTWVTVQMIVILGIIIGLSIFALHTTTDPVPVPGQFQAWLPSIQGWGG